MRGANLCAGAGAVLSANAESDPRTGSVTRPANNFLLLTSGISDSFPSLGQSCAAARRRHAAAAGLRIGLCVAGNAHVKAQHHGVVFMNYVVAVHHVAAQPVAETH